MEWLFFLVIVFVVVSSILGVIARVIWTLFWIQQFQRAVGQIVNAYNRPIQNEFIELARALQRHQEAQAQAAAQRAREQIERIPRRERSRQREALTDIVKGKVVLNERTGELVQQRV